MYTVPSVSVPVELHTVAMETGICTCHVGRTGCICKRQAVVAVSTKHLVSQLQRNFSPIDEIMIAFKGRSI